MSDFADLTAGWDLVVTMQLRTPLKWLRRHREFHAGAERPTEALPPEHACWMPVPKSWRELGIVEDEVPESAMVSEVGQLPVDGGDFLPFLMEYRMIVEGAAEALRVLGERHPRYAALLTGPARRVRKQKGVAKLQFVPRLTWLNHRRGRALHHAGRVGLAPRGCGRISCIAGSNAQSRDAPGQRAESSNGLGI